MRLFKHYSDVPKGWWRWPDFSPREMASKREGELGINESAMDKLQRLRTQLGRPLLITSAYRSQKHNAAVGGAKNSQHLKGCAFDVRMDNQTPKEFEAAARAVGFTGFGYYPKQGFMHIDTGPSRTWGTPFPQTETKLPLEPISDTADKKAAVGAGGAGVLAVALEHLPVAGGIVGQLAPWAQLAAVVAAALFIGYIIWRRRYD